MHRWSGPRHPNSPITGTKIPHPARSSSASRQRPPLQRRVSVCPHRCPRSSWGYILLCSDLQRGPEADQTRPTVQSRQGRRRLDRGGSSPSPLNDGRLERRRGRQTRCQRYRGLADYPICARRRTRVTVRSPAGDLAPLRPLVGASSASADWRRANRLATGGGCREPPEAALPMVPIWARSRARV